MFNFGIAELIILLACCSLPIAALISISFLSVLVRWGIIGHYWLKGEEPVQQGGNYTLEQSKGDFES